MAALALLAVVLRVAAVAVAGDLERPNAMEHESLARSLLAGNGFAFNNSLRFTEYGMYAPSSVQSPTYPLFLAGLYALLGERAAAAHAVAVGLNALLGGLVVVLTYLLVGAMAGRGPPGPWRAAGVIAAALAAVWPTQVYSAVAVQAIVAITACTLAVPVLWYRSLDTGRLTPWVAFSLIGCLGALTEPVLLPPMALAGAWVLVTRRLPGRLRLRNGAVLLATAVVVIGPWTWRNYRVHGAFMPVKSTFWVNVWKGNNAADPEHTGTDRPAGLSRATLADLRRRGFGPDDVRQYELLTAGQRREMDRRTEAELERIFARHVREFVRDEPGTYAATSVKRLVKTLWWDWDNPQSSRLAYAYPASRAALLVGTVAGLVAVGRRWRLGMPALVAGTAVGMYALTITAARFAFPLEPFQFALCGAALAQMFRNPRTIGSIFRRNSALA